MHPTRLSKNEQGLLQCPFCGQEPIRLRTKNVIACVCGAAMAVTSKDGFLNLTIEEKWNKRCSFYVKDKML